MKLARKLPSPALSISVAALVVALGGTSYAAGLIGGEDVRNGSLTGKDVKDDSLSSVDLRDRSVRARDIAPNAYLKGPKGDKGDQGPAGIGRWLLVDANGAIVAQSGGFAIKSAYDVVNNTGGTVPAAAFGNVYINANEPLDDNGIVVSVALQNQVDQNADGIMNGTSANPDANPEFSGEITATMCNIPGVVVCGPPTTNDINHLVVSPRLSDGQRTSSTNRKRFYVIVTGDSTDFVAP